MRQSLKDNIVAHIDDTLYFLSDDASKLTSWSKDYGVELIGDEPGISFTEIHVINDSLFYVKILDDLNQAVELCREDPDQMGVEQGWAEPAIINAYLDLFA